MVAYRQFEHVVESTFNIAASLGSHENIDFVEIRATIQQFLQENFTHETRSASNKYGFAYVEGLSFGLCYFFLHDCELKLYRNSSIL